MAVREAPRSQVQMLNTLRAATGIEFGPTGAIKETFVDLGGGSAYLLLPDGSAFIPSTVPDLGATANAAYDAGVVGVYISGTYTTKTDLSIPAARFLVGLGSPYVTTTVTGASVINCASVGQAPTLSKVITTAGTDATNVYRPRVENIRVNGNGRTDLVAGLDFNHVDAPIVSNFFVYQIAGASGVGIRVPSSVNGQWEMVEANSCTVGWSIGNFTSNPDTFHRVNNTAFTSCRAKSCTTGVVLWGDPSAGHIGVQGNRLMVFEIGDNVIGLEVKNGARNNYISVWFESNELNLLLGNDSSACDGNLISVFNLGNPPTSPQQGSPRLMKIMSGRGNKIEIGEMNTQHITGDATTTGDAKIEIGALAVETEISCTNPDRSRDLIRNIVIDNGVRTVLRTGNRAKGVIDYQAPSLRLRDAQLLLPFDELDTTVSPVSALVDVSVKQRPLSGVVVGTVNPGVDNFGRYIETTTNQSGLQISDGVVWGMGASWTMRTRIYPVGTAAGDIFTGYLTAGATSGSSRLRVQWLDGGTVYVIIWDGSAMQTYAFSRSTSQKLYPTGNWYDVCVVYDNATTTVKAYIDGEELPSLYGTTGSNPAAVVNGISAGIAKVDVGHTGSAALGFIGRFKGVMVWDALVHTPAQVAQIVNTADRLMLPLAQASLQLATTARRGAVLKAAARSATDPPALTDNSGGTSGGNTIASVAAAPVDANAAGLASTRNAIATLAAKLQVEIDRRKDLEAKLATAGVLT